MEGYNAFDKKILPKNCPYLNDTGDNSLEILAWMDGWSDSFLDW